MPDLGSEEYYQIVLRKYFPDDFVGFAVELGAYDGIFLSKTLELEKRGWTCLCIEPNPDQYEILIKNRKLALNRACSYSQGSKVLFDVRYNDSYSKDAALSSLADGDKRLLGLCPWSTLIKTVEVEVDTLDNCLEKSGFNHVDFVSVDVEGGELNVLKGFNVRRWNPTLVVVESHFADQEIRDLMKSHGYKLDVRDGIDEYYVKE